MFAEKNCVQVNMPYRGDFQSNIRDVLISATVLYRYGWFKNILLSSSVKTQLSHLESFPITFYEIKLLTARFLVRRMSQPKPKMRLNDFLWHVTR